MKSSSTLSRALVLDRSWSIFTDLSVAAAALAGFYALVKIASYWLGKPIPAVDISQSISALPLYAIYSIVRIGAAYVLSLLFAVGYGYVAAYNPRAEALMIAILDILQSIPVLSFLPGVMLAMVALIPTRQLGIELGAILLIFTGQVWNMAFSFYSSLKSIPKELREASNIYRFSAWQRFWQLELPYSAIGLVWNSMVSVAGGWFFLIACEMFVLGDRDFRLPGLGSYLQTAASTGNSRAVLWGLITMVLIIVATDQLVWRPIIAWSDKFKFEMTESNERVRSPILYLLQRSSFVTALRTKTIENFGERIQHGFATRRSARTIQPLDDDTKRQLSPLSLGLAILGGLVILYAALQAVAMLRHIGLHEFSLLLLGAGATFLRVNTALILASLWTIPVGVMIGFHPKLARITQPITQIAASFPAPFLFPIIILGLQWLHLGTGRRRHRPHVAGHSVVHPFQRNCRSHGHSVGSAGSCQSLPLYAASEMDDRNPSRNFSVSHHRPGHGVRRRMERQHHRGVLQPARPYSADCGAGRTDKCSLRSRPVPHPAGGDFDHGNHGGYY